MEVFVLFCFSEVSSYCCIINSLHINSDSFNSYLGCSQNPSKSQNNPHQTFYPLSPWTTFTGKLKNIVVIAECLIQANLDQMFFNTVEIHFHFPKHLFSILEHLCNVLCSVQYRSPSWFTKCHAIRYKISATNSNRKKQFHYYIRKGLMMLVNYKASFQGRTYIFNNHL